ncbi:cytochrome P460 family protein [Desulfobacula toluolica]|uniref:cytochrome P460 family protein n=1 Tax=Desulfobacula toluolica TaxID=28223 RepID=UPI0002EF97C6|nr:cytochrome P460 family protein [Desulfobacula toluolica]
MKKTLFILSLVIIATLGFTACMQKNMTMQQDVPPFGSEYDVAYSNALWKVLEKEKLVGPDQIRALPYEGMEPHGVILEQLSTNVTVNGHTGIVYVKANYMGDGMTRSKVVNDPDQYLVAVTVMFKREKGYDPDNQDWFWVKYKSDGSLFANPKGVMLAGRVAKGMNTGCIACHTGADGGDYLFNNTASHLD